MLLLLFYQGSFSPFSDVPVLRQGGVPRRVKRKGSETFANPEPLREIVHEITAVQTRETAALVRLRALEAAASTGQAKAANARHTAAAGRARASVATLGRKLEALNVAMTVENARIARDTEEADIIFIATILSEA